MITLVRMYPNGDFRKFHTTNPDLANEWLTLNQKIRPGNTLFVNGTSQETHPERKAEAQHKYQQHQTRIENQKSEPLEDAMKNQPEPQNKPRSITTLLQIHFIP